MRVPGDRAADRHSHKIEAHADFILDAVARKPITLVELRALLEERGVSAGVGTLWRFFDVAGSR